MSINRNLFARGSFLGLRTFVLIVLSLLLMFGNYRLHFIHRLKDHLSGAVAPLHYTVNFPLRTIDRLYNYFVTHHNLLKENAVLSTQNLFLRDFYHRYSLRV